MLKKQLLFVVLSFTFLAKAQKLYWVGGSGYWHDAQHWSFVSGGIPANVVPSSNSTIIFDNASSSSSFTIHALKNIAFNTIEAGNTQFDIEVIGSPNVNVNITGNVHLNEYFHLKTSGNIYLNPLSSAEYQFSHNKFNNNIFIRSNSAVKLGVLSTSKTIHVSGNFVLKNSILFAKHLKVANATLNLVNNTLQITDSVVIDNSRLVVTGNEKTAIICQKNELLPFTLAQLKSIEGLTLSQMMPAACLVTLSGSSNPSCSNNCNGTASFNLSGCTNSPYSIQWLNTDPSVACQTLPPAENAYAGTSYSVNTLCGCGTQYIILFENAVGEQFAIQLTITNPAATLLTFAQTQPTCNGFCNGQIRVTVTSGVTPLSINWNPTNTTHSGIITRDTLKNACAGNYTVTATNSNSCVTTFTPILVQPPVLLANGSSSSITCNGACTGSATLSPTGGTTPYVYIWSPATSVSSNISGLCAGVVSGTVTDTKNCKATYSVTITQPPAITLTVTKSNLICGAVCDGTAGIAASGGTGAYTYLWAPSGPSGSSATGLCAGNYTVTVTDALNCTKSVTFQITAPPTLTASPTQTNVTCNGLCNASINLQPSGGNPGYTYSWGPSISSSSLATGVCVGVYSYTVTDLFLCTFSNTVSITQPPTLTLTTTKTDISCFGACNGIAIANLGGGTSPYSYTWSPGSPTGQSTGTITGLCIGTYSISVRDANGCRATASAIINQPLDIVINSSTVSPTCNGICNGVINASPSGGTTPYSYTLQPSSGAPMTGGVPFTGLCAGNYTLTLRDAMGCVKTRTINLTQPNAITLALNSTTISCFNQCNATISSVVGGGTPAYSYTWNTGSNASSLLNQCAGIYTATVRDGNGCRATASVNVISPTDMTVSISPTNPNCNAQCTGIASATVSGGTPNYTINWNTGATGNTASGLCQGNYTATVTDRLGCIKRQTVAIVTPPALTLTSTNGTVSCAGTCDGTVSVLASGGTAGYFVSWNTVPVQSSTVATGLCVGNYAATVTDSKGCTASVGANVAQPAVLTSSVGNVVPSCNICIGSATGSGIGGTAPYSYSWSPSGQTTALASNLCTGVQTLVVTDNRGCTSTSTVQINQTVIVLLTSNGNTLACSGACSGVASANASGGLAPYSYTWTPAPVQNTQIASNLCAGTHTVIVADANGCSNNGTVIFVSPPAITLTVNKTDITCNGACNGIATATASGGTGLKTYVWQPGGFTTPSISGLCPGDYTVTVTDASSCTQSQVVTITQSNSLTATFINNNPTGCVSSDGSISFVPGGGVAPYSFTWTPGGSANPLTGLADGIYVLNLRDNNGCRISYTTTLSDPSGPTVTPTTNSIVCFGQCTGSSSLSITGNGPFLVSWPGIPSTNTVVTNLCAGNYVVQVTDNNSCITNQNVSITQPTQITSTGISSDATCHLLCNGSVNMTPSGGVAPYSFFWSPAGGNVEDPTGLCADTYSVNITDANNCIVTNTFLIAQPSALNISFNKKDVLCQGGCTGGVRAIAAGGTAPYSYSWTPLGTFSGSTIDTIVNLCSGIYQVSVRDGNGCSFSSTVSIGEPAVLTSTLTAINAKCNGQCNGQASFAGSGGTPPYSFFYNTSPVSTTQTVTNLCLGAYVGIITDANGCSNTKAFTITQPAAITITTTPSHPKCNAVCNGSIATTVSGGNPSYHYSWLPSGGGSQNPTGLCAGNYVLTVTDDSLCTGVALVTLIDPPALISNITHTNPTCSGGCNGLAMANPTGGTLPYTYVWANPISVGQTVTGLCAGSYSLTLTDANACQDIQVVTLVAPPSISVNPAVTPASCGSNNGSISAIAYSGNAPYAFNWLPPVLPAQATNTTVTGLAAGMYTVVVRDASLCTATIAIPLSNSNGPSSVTVTYTDVACHGQCNGAAEITNPVGGAGPYTISWTVPVSANSVVTNLCAGNYVGLVTDVNNCLLFQNITITEPQLIDDNENIAIAACFGNCNGSIALNPTGGNGGYVYAWSNAAITPSIVNLCPGPYSVTITDSKNCTLTASYTMPSLTTITSSLVVTNNTCFSDCNGNILATNLAGGTPPYGFNWSDPLGQSGATAIGLCNGNYSVTITDAIGCYGNMLETITSPSSVTFTSSVTQPACGLCDGSAVITPMGGTLSYSIVWSNSQTGSTASNLCAGVYGVQITDGNGCVSSNNVVIDNSSTITGETVLSSNELCFGACDGTASVTAIGGAAPINYHWVHNGATSQNLNGMCSGTYFCNMTDRNGCTRTASIVIGSVATLSITSQVTQSSCSINTGSVVVSVTGGVGGYTYSWLPLGTGSTPTVTNLAPGSYTLTVTDGNGCTSTQLYAIGSINGPSITFDQQNTSCGSTCNGSIALNLTGGNPGYAILWSNAANTATVSNLCAGAYSVRVTDVIGCVAVQNFSVTSLPPIVFSAPTIHQPTCHDNCDGSLAAIPSGGSLPYTYNWSPGGTPTLSVTSLCSGSYSIQVTDASGCSASGTYTLINPSAITLNSTVTPASCNTTTDGSINLSVGGGVPAYSYSWTNTAVTKDLINVPSGSYSVTLTDQNGCKKDTAFIIDAGVTVNAITGRDTTFCQNGVFTLNGSASNGGVSYQWLELPLGTVVSNTTVVTINPVIGTSTFVLVAVNGACIDRDTILLTSFPLPLVDAGPFVTIPMLTSTVIGGSPTGPSGSSYTWSPGTFLDNSFGSNPTTSNTVTTMYTVTVVDANGCRNSDTVTVLVTPQIKIPNGFSPNGDGKNDTWMIDLIYQFPDCEVEVYNRWGEQLFYAKGYSTPWNGQYKGKNLPVGTYYYIIHLNHPAYPDVYSGPLTIFR